MADNDQTNGQATEATEATVAKMYTTREDALAARPADASKHLKPFEVTHTGTVLGWVLARGYDNALAVAAKLGGYTVSTGNKTAVVTKESMTAVLDAMSDTDRAAFLAKYLPAPAPTTKGRKASS